jgi:hypothetical protein
MMGTMANTLFRVIAVLSLPLLWGQAQAQEVDTYEADPPERAARLSHLEGDVVLQPAGEEEWAPALLNRPLTTGDKLWTEPGARAEISVGPADVRLDSLTGFSFLDVDNEVVQMRITAGVINVRVRPLLDNEHVEIDTPNAAVSLQREGSYRVEVNDAGDTTVVKVADGAAEVTGPSQNVMVNADQAVTFTGTDTLVAQFNKLGPPDDFDSWSSDRARRYERAASSRTAQYVSPDVTGYEDLDDNGSWSSEPEYGYVWTPTRVAIGWSPYRYGRWVSVSPWGWTWIDDAPWGYAPFHYGRWAHVRNRWCWVPGPRHTRAVFAPALVGWVGSPGHYVSWFPLGPREVYVPGHRHSWRYFDRVNHANTLVVRGAVRQAFENRTTNQNYRNRGAPGGVTTVSQGTFTSAGRTGRQHLQGGVPSTAPATGLAPRIAPSRESRLGGAVRANLRVPPRNLVDRQVVTRRAPPPAAARFARRPEASQDGRREPPRITTRDFERPPNRGGDRGERRIDVGDGERSVRQREDRPWRSGRPVESTPQVVSPVSDPRGIAARVRQDGERQAREQQQRRELDQRQHDSQRESRNQRWQQPDAQPRPSREREQAVREPRYRERVERAPDVQRSAPRQVEQRERPAPPQREQHERPPQRQQVERQSRPEGRGQSGAGSQRDQRPERGDRKQRN